MKLGHYLIGFPVLDMSAISRVKSPALVMNKTPDNAGGAVLAEMRKGDPDYSPNNEIDGRIFRTMAFAVGLIAVVASLAVRRVASDYGTAGGRSSFFAESLLADQFDDGSI